jgi:polygalacturonase
MITTIIGFLISSLLSLSSPEMNSLISEKKLTEITLKPAGTSLMTDMIQQAIDRCAESGGGIVHFTAGEYYSGTIQLKNNITLNLVNCESGNMIVIKKVSFNTGSNLKPYRFDNIKSVELTGSDINSPKQ